MSKSQEGFTVVELLITLFVAVAFLVAGWQVYSLVIRESGEARSKSRAINIAYDYIQRYSGQATTPCTTTNPLTDSPVSISGLGEALVSIAISCPQSNVSAVSKIQATIKYGSPQQTTVQSTLVNKIDQTTLESGLVGWWTMNGNVNNNNSSINNGITAGSALAYNEGPNARAGSASTFNGTNNYVSIVDNDSIDFGTKSFTISFWSYRTALGYQGGAYINKGTSATQPGFYSFDNIFLVRTTTGTLASIALSASLNVWENHTLVINQLASPYIKHYINGVLNQTGYTETGNVGSIDNSNSLVIGYSAEGGPSRYYNGSIDDLRIYSRALTASEISALYALGAF